MIRFPTQGDVPSMLRLLAFWSCLFLLPLGMTLATAQEASQAAESQAAAENESKALDDPSASAPSEQSAPEQSAPEQATGPQVRFHRDVLPIFQKRCQSCHGAEDAKADFRIDDRDAVLGYIEPGDAEASSLWTDYLTADPDAEESQLMPPVSEEPLTMAELATIRWWIEQGAEWPESLGVPEEEGPKVRGVSGSWPERLWRFYGYFHPALVHFPIALLVVGAVAVPASLLLGRSADRFAAVCLWLGTLGAIAAAAAGWSFAELKGYQLPFTPLDQFKDTTFFWHRWLGVSIAFLGTVLSYFALVGLREGARISRIIWRVGLLGLAALVGVVGHQGGELVYGEKMFDEAFELLIPVPEPPQGGPADPIGSGRVRPQ